MTTTNKSLKIFTYFVLISLALIWLTPLFFTFLTAFKDMNDYANQHFYQLPTHFAFFDNLTVVMDQYRLNHHFASSLCYMSLGGLFCIIASSMAAYSIVRLKPKGNFWLFLLIYSGTVFPFQMYLIPLYKMYNTIGLYNTRAGMILIYTAITIPFALFVYKGFFVTIPKAIEDAARIDGCTPTKAYYAIFIPQAGAPTAVVALFQMSWIWNDLLFGMILSRSEDVRPIMVALATMSGIGGSPLTLQMTGVILTSIPTLIIFIALQKYFIAGISNSSALK